MNKHGLVIAFAKANIVLQFQKMGRTSLITTLYLFKKLALFFEFDYNVKTIKWIPVLQKMDRTRRVMFLLFSWGYYYKPSPPSRRQTCAAAGQ